MELASEYECVGGATKKKNNKIDLEVSKTRECTCNFK